ncbi:S8 family serine peptidase [Litoribacter ruber]|nr:S8 family serine peptidase [Litoribacter alkaliphilus]
MFKPVYRFIGKPLTLSAFCLAIMASGCQDSLDEQHLNPDNLDAEEEFVGYLNGDIIPGQYIVILNEQGITFRKDGTYAEIQAAMKKGASDLLLGHKIGGENLKEVFGASVEGFSVRMTDEEYDRVSQDPRVKYIEEDRMMAVSRPRRNQSNRWDNSGPTNTQEVSYGVTRVGGATSYTGDNVAYVLDSGIDLDHEDLNVNASRGFNAFTSGSDAESLNDENGHGTHVAGIIGALDNNVGVVGVAAGAPVVPIKVLDAGGSGPYSGVIAGIDFVAANGNAGDVANLSLGGPGSNAMDDAVIAAANKGIYFVLAAGNNNNDAEHYSPGRVNGQNIYTISAMDSRDRFASFSNYGNPPIDYCAPGVGVNSTWLNNQYRVMSGTSMAAPHVAGIRLLGEINSDGRVRNDPDGNRDIIAVK